MIHLLIAFTHKCKYSYKLSEADGVKFLKEDIKVSKDGLLKHDPNRLSPKHCTSMSIEDIEVI